MRGLVIWNTYAQPLVIKRLGIVDLCLADSNNKKGNDWYYTPIRVGVIGDEVRLLSAKTQYGWSNCGSKASDVGAWDSEEIRDNFNYKVYSTLHGTIYF